MSTDNVAASLLARFRSRGVDRFYVNAGTDFAPLVEAYASLRRGAEDVFPRPVVAAHENLAMGMAHGAYLLTGRPQVVMFHVNVGTANAVCAAINAAAEQVPLVILAGRTPIFEQGVLGSRNTRVSWAQEMYDQAALVRECVKWEYELRDGAQVDDVVDRALTIAMTEPRGPVYLTLPREVLAREGTIRPAASGLTVPTAAAPAAEAVAALAERIAAADFPVVSAIASGAEPSSVAALATLCDRFAIGYVEEQARYLNLPDDHPMHLGFALAPVFAEADVLCFVETDVPWIPAFGEPRADAFVAQAGFDPTVSRIPIRSHRSDLSITTSPTRLFEALAAALAERRIDPRRRERVAARASALRGRREQATKAELAKSGPITPAFATATLARLLHPSCAVFNEYSAPRGELSFTEPRSTFYLPATGGLGWALPAAIGAKQIAPERTMIATVGDGTYLFSNPAACHHASEKHGLPVLTVVLNNARWGAVDWTAKLVYPKGALAALEKIELSDLSPSPAFERAIEASNGLGLRVERREDLAAAYERALRAVEVEKRQALVNVICT